jgi:ketol-acid reductoisomerase
MHSYSAREASLDLVRHKKVAILGYGSQGHAQALNLRDSGVKSLKVGLPAASASVAKAKADGFSVVTPDKAAAWADITMMLAPDEIQATLYARDLLPNFPTGAALGFAHGFNIHFGYITPRPDLDVFMVAPKQAGPAVRRLYEERKGAPCLVAVHQDKSGQAMKFALSYAEALMRNHAGIYETTFKEECEVDLFGEQAVLMGGIPFLMRAAYETLVKASYDPEMAYFKCLQQAKLVTDLIAERGVAAMYGAVSNTAEYGGYVAGPKLVTEQTHAAMQQLLADVQSGAFAKAWMAENKTGHAWFAEQRREMAASDMEEAGKRLRKTSRDA